MTPVKVKLVNVERGRWDYDQLVTLTDDPIQVSVTCPHCHKQEMIDIHAFNFYEDSKGNLYRSAEICECGTIQLKLRLFLEVTQ